MTARPPTSRAQQRQHTEARILTSARQLFADRGYERTTIRAVAAAAEVDAGLVMHYFGSKEALFSQAVKIDGAEAATGSPPQIAESLLRTLRDRLLDEPLASLAVLRSMLTHPEAADSFRAAAQPRMTEIQNAIPAPRPDLRAGLLNAIINGVIMDRYLLKLSPLSEASADEIIDLLRPCFLALVDPPTSA